MKSTLLATVAIAALAIGGSMAGAQERGGEMRGAGAPASGAMSGPSAGGGAAERAPAERAPAERSAPRAAQSEPNAGAAQSGHATGRERAAEQRDSTGPNHATGNARAEERHSDAPKSSAAEADKSKAPDAKQQAQQDKKEPSRAATGETQDRSKSQARDDRAPSAKGTTAAGEQDRKADQAQKAPTAQEPTKSGAAATQQNRNAASAQDRSPQDRNSANASDRGSRDSNRDSASTRGSQDVSVTGSLQVDRQKATRVHDELIRSAPRTDIDISVSVGTTLPERVRARPVPESIVTISPEFRGYDYVVVHDEIVIVEPKTKKVVTIIESKSRPHKAQRASLTLNSSQKSRIRSDIKMESARNVDIEVREGRVVPQTVVLQPLPDVIYGDVPEMRDYRYFVDDRRIIIVDPDTREVVDIID